MDNSVNIREAAPADLDAVVAVENASFNSDRFSRRQFSYLVSQAKGIFYVAESDKHITGYISLLQRSTNLRIYSIAVHPGARGQHIGQKLIDKSMEYAKARSLRQISLEVRTDNSVAIALYRKNGFAATSVIKRYYDDGSDALLMNIFLESV